MLSDAKITPTIPASDMERAKKFYSETLGLKARGEMDDGVMYDCGGGTGLILYESGGAGTSQATYAAWEVDDLAAEMARLREQGVTFEDYDMPGLKTVDGVATHSGGKGAWFKDSEGNILALNEMV
jgi:predicted enzyme related to lactoylglutathione lyase